MCSPKTRLFILSIGLGSLAMAVAVASPLEKRSQQGRKSTDAPIAARGKLGQDLFLALDHRDEKALESLLKNGADPNSRNGLGFVPLYMATASHQPEAMKALLAAKALPDADSSYGTPLMFAASSANVEGAGLLLSRGAKVNAIRDDGMSVLMMASNTGAPPMVSLLLQNKADATLRDDDGLTALNYAARMGNTVVAQMLLDAGASVDSADFNHRTPLMEAAQVGHADVVELLLKKGANPNLKDSVGRTPLLLSSEYGNNPSVISALVKGGADTKATDAKGRTAADLARLHGYRDALAVLANNSTLESAKGPVARNPHDAVNSSLKLLQSSMLKFSSMARCVSCHQEGLGRMATGLAKDHGFSLNRDVQRTQVERVDGMLTALRPLHERALIDPETMKQVPLIEINEVNTSDTWFLAGKAAHREPRTVAASAMAMVLAKQQSPDGKWAFSGPRAPMQSSAFTFTALSVRALEAYGPKTKYAEVSSRIRKAKSWLLRTPAVTSEDRASRLLGLDWVGASVAAKSKAVEEILKDQRSDGGWAQLPDLHSDAYATGQALFALHEAGKLPISNPAYQRGVKFLLRTQDDDGSWFVSKRANPNNNYFDAGFPHGQSQYASFNGTCWATMALLETLPVSRRHLVASRS